MVQAKSLVALVVGLVGFVVRAGAGGAMLSIFQALVDGLPVLPAASVARTPNVWLPCARLEYDAGLVHVAYVPPSREQAYRRLVSGPEKEKAAVVELASAAGAEVIAGCPGATVS